MKIATRETIKEIDRVTIEKYGVPGIVLMENAGRAVASVIRREFPDKDNISVFCGGGNNGGDGFVTARHLINTGKKVTTYLLQNRNEYSGDARTNLNSLSKISKDIKRLKSSFSNYQESDLVVDSIFGTGLDREIKGPYRKIIERINSLKVPKVAVDLPSGIDANKGTPLGSSVIADVTVTFVVPKLGISIYPGLDHCGKIYVAGITTPKILEDKILYELVTFKKCRSIIKKRPHDTHKGNYGHTLIVAGSSGKTGAAALCAHASVRSGSGLVTVGVPRSVLNSVDEKIIEAMSLGLRDDGSGFLSDVSLDQVVSEMSSKTSLAIGPGISVNQGTKDLLFKVLVESQVPVVADADAVNIIAENKDLLKKLKVPVILTPHPGEMARLMGMTTREVQLNRVKHAEEFAVSHKCYVVLKGARSVIATPDGCVFINPTGNPAMSSGGMGDVLTGVISGLISQKYSPLEACLLGTFVHGLSGDIEAEEKGPSGITATDVADSIPRALKQVQVQDGEPFFETIC